MPVLTTNFLRTRLGLDFGMVKLVCSFAAFFSVTYYCQVSQAQYLTGPVAMALGGAGRAASEDGEQFMLNPASIVESSQISSSVFYSDGYNGVNQHDNYFGATLTDNEDDVWLAGAYSYVHRDRTFLNANDLIEDYHQVSAGRWVVKHLALGLNVNYMQSQIANMSNLYVQWNGHVGAFYVPTKELAIGFVAYNILGRDETVPVEIQQSPKLALGVTYIFMPQIRGRIDISQVQVQNPNHDLEYQLGFETRTSEFFLFRAGYDQDDLNQIKYWSVGLAFDGPRIKIDYFFRENFGYGSGGLHGIDIRLPFW